MGDTVNLAARLESSCKQYGVYTQISESTYLAVKDQVTARELDRIIVVGRKEPVTTYELVSMKGAEPENMKNLLPGFARLYAATPALVIPAPDFVDLKFFLFLAGIVPFEKSFLITLFPSFVF